MPLSMQFESLNSLFNSEAEMVATVGPRSPAQGADKAGEPASAAPAPEEDEQVANDDAEAHEEEIIEEDPVAEVCDVDASAPNVD